MVTGAVKMAAWSIGCSVDGADAAMLRGAAWQSTQRSVGWAMAVTAPPGTAWNVVKASWYWPSTKELTTPSVLVWQCQHTVPSGLVALPGLSAVGNAADVCTIWL